MPVLPNPIAHSTMVPAVSQLVELQGYSYEDNGTVAAALLETLKRCGCWAEERLNVAPSRMDICFEVRLSAADEIYSGLVAAGVEFTREAHQAMTWLCTLRRHEGPRSFRTVCVRMEMSFLEEYAQEMGMMATGHA
jgi:hypothetical protein